MVQEGNDIVIDKVGPVNKPPSFFRSQFSRGVSGHTQPASSMSAPHKKAGTWIHAKLFHLGTRNPPKTAKRTKARWAVKTRSARA